MTTTSKLLACRMVKVEWEDAGSQDAWQSVSDIDTEPIMCVTVGVLCKETPDRLFIACTLRPHADEVSCVMQIPRSQVRMIHDLCEAESPEKSS